jgi:hypothetical protein
MFYFKINLVLVLACEIGLYDLCNNIEITYLILFNKDTNRIVHLIKNKFKRNVILTLF